MTAPTVAMPNGPSAPSSRPRVVAFVAICLVAVALGAVGVLWAVDDRADVTITDSTDPPAERLTNVGTDDGGSILLFENTSPDVAYGKVAAVPADNPSAPRRVSEMACERVDFRAGRGVCLRSDRGFVTTYEAVVFDADLREGYRIGLSGPPSRVRVSPDGSHAAITVFVSGHSYASTGFSTQTMILDLDEERVVADLEVDFTVVREGEDWHEIDFNFWGVTFVDDQRFYATLGTGGRYYLVEGDLVGRRLDVLRDGVECPSLSPDGTRVAFKVRSDPGLGPTSWRIAVLDLATRETTMLAEMRNVDDQVAWLDDSTVIYGLPHEDSLAEADTWAVAADGSGQPRLLVPQAWSTVVVAP